jgi:hypothetical protein
MDNATLEQPSLWVAFAPVRASAPIRNVTEEFVVVSRHTAMIPITSVRLDVSRSLQPHSWTRMTLMSSLPNTQSSAATITNALDVLWSHWEEPAQTTGTVQGESNATTISVVL